MILQKERDILWIVLRFSNDMVGISSNGNFLIGRLQASLVRLANTANTSLTSLYVCQLLNETFATRPTISCFRCTMLQFTLTAAIIVNQMKILMTTWDRTRTGAVE